MKATITFDILTETVVSDESVIDSLTNQIRAKLPDLVTREYNEYLRGNPCVCTVPERMDILFDSNGNRVGSLRIDMNN